MLSLIHSNRACFFFPSDSAISDQQISKVYNFLADVWSMLTIAYFSYLAVLQFCSARRELKFGWYYTKSYLPLLLTRVVSGAILIARQYIWLEQEGYISNLSGSKNREVRQSLYCSFFRHFHTSSYTLLYVSGIHLVHQLTQAHSNNINFVYTMHFYHRHQLSIWLLPLCYYFSQVNSLLEEEVVIKVLALN